jgi:hypothetical protein
MPFGNYAQLQTAIATWLARPADPLITPSIPDMIYLFEVEANRRLRIWGNETGVYLSTTPELPSLVLLPTDFWQARTVAVGERILEYVPHRDLPRQSGEPSYYTIVDNYLQVGPIPSGPVSVALVYNQSMPFLSSLGPTGVNWLLLAAPDAYLFGSLVEAEAFIGEDERAQGWLARREAAFEALQQADRKLRWGGPMQIRLNQGYPGTGGSAAPALAPSVDEVNMRSIDVSTSHAIGNTEAGNVWVQDLTEAITITLPTAPTIGQQCFIKDTDGSAAAWSITVQSVGGLIDDQLSYTINYAFGGLRVTWSGEHWSVG